MTPWIYADAADPLPELAGSEVYYLVTSSEGSLAKCQSFDTREFLAAELTAMRSALSSGRFQAFVFCGRRLQVTAPPFAYLVDGFYILPLFVVPKPIPMSNDSGDLSEAEDRKTRPAGYDDLTARAAAEAAAMLQDPMSAPGGLPIED